MDGLVEIEAAWREARGGYEADIDRHFERYVEELKELCRLPSLSTDLAALGDCASYLRDRLDALGFETAIEDVNGPGSAPIVLARRHRDDALPTLLIYGHFDVQPVDPESAWTNRPFDPTEREGYLYGRGTADDKGQFLAHLKAVEMIDRLGAGPVANLILVLDSQEEVGSPHLAAFVERNRAKLAADYVFYADGEAFVGNRIMIQHGNRGDCFITIRHRSGGRDTHSGTYGGVVPNAANQLVAFLATLVDENGVVQIPGFYDDVVPPTAADREAMARLPHDQAAFERMLGLSRPFGPAGLDHWEKIMFRPTLNISGLTAGFQGAGTKTVIPCEATAKIDMRLVKNQTPEDILAKFRRHAAAMGMGGLEIEKGMQYLPARTAIDHPYCLLVRRALGEGFDQEPVVTPVVGGSNPNHVWMERLGLPMAEVSYGQHDCRMHAPDERYDLDHYRRGILTSALVMTGVARLPSRQQGD
jgi:acetylornithine deacetylase/succinyl-diaminopimelate desuccinylase-like protein